MIPFQLKIVKKTADTVRTDADTVRTQCGLSAKNADTCGHMRTDADTCVFNTNGSSDTSARPQQRQQTNRGGSSSAPTSSRSAAAALNNLLLERADSVGPASYLAAAGIVDADTVDESNLQRQIIDVTSTIGVTKCESAEQLIRDINPHISVRTCVEEFASSHALGILSKGFSPAESADAAQGEVRRTITMYPSGFTVDNGPHRQLSDPSNAEFLTALARGMVPRELHEGGDGEVRLDWLINVARSTIPTGTGPKKAREAGEMHLNHSRGRDNH
jgi:hypothetical protein